MPCAVTLTVNKGEAKSKGKTKAGAGVLSRVDAEAAGALARGSPRVQWGCGELGHKAVALPFSALGNSARINV